MSGLGAKVAPTERLWSIWKRIGCWIYCRIVAARVWPSGCNAIPVLRSSVEIALAHLPAPQQKALPKPLRLPIGFIYMLRGICATVMIYALWQSHVGVFAQCQREEAIMTDIRWER